MWNAEIYNRYGKERIQPSIDFVARIKDMKFQRILDVGCGTGMSTVPLVSVSTCKEFLQVQTEGKRKIKRKKKHYNFKMILAIA